MDRFSQKYTIAYILDELPDGYEYAMEDWPLHVTLADVFAITSPWKEVIQDLETTLASTTAISTRISAEDRFGKNKNVRVKLLENTDSLQALHETVVSVVRQHGGVFNTPDHIGRGFKPHSTVQRSREVKIGQPISIHSLTLIDMFPDGNAYKRRILQTIKLRSPPRLN